MATKIVTKNSSTASAVPTASDLVQGELAVNVADKRLFTEDNAGAIVELGTNPTTLNVNGTATMDGLVVQQPSGANILLESTTTGATTGDIFGEIEFKTNDSSSAGVKGKIDSYSEGGVGNGALRLFTGNTTGLYERMHIDSSGSVGIGTSSPSASKFSSTPDGVLNVSGTKPVVYLTEEGETDSNVWMGLSNEVGIIGNTGDGIAFRTGASTATESARIDASGKVGIGMTPSKLLDIQATDNLALRFYNSTSFKAGLEVATTAGDMIAGSAVDDLAIRAQTNMLFATGGNTERMRLDSDGATIYNGKELRIKRPNGSGDIRLFNTSTYATIESTVDPIYIKSANAIRFDTNGNDQRMLIDNAGNLLVGQTVGEVIGVGNTTEGISLGANGRIFASYNGQPAYLNRNGTDGAILGFYRGGTSVGSIGIGGGALGFGQGTGNLGFFNANVIPMGNTSGGASDGVIDLGYYGRRFKNLFLSGGVYLGGTDAANKLDDYEEGSWTTGLNSGSFSSVTAKYTKIGRVVTLTLDATVGSGGGSTLTLPFTCTNTTGNAIYVSSQDFTSGRTQMCWVAASNLLYFRTIGDNIVYSSQALTAGATIHASITYNAS